MNISEGTGIHGRNLAAGSSVPPLWAWLALAGAVVGGTGSIIGLFLPGPVYGQETAGLANAALAQDAVNLFVVAPATVVLALCALRGSARSWLVLPGFLAFTAYNYSIYVFSIHFGPLFLLWVPVLGLSVFAFAGVVSASGAAGDRRVSVGRAAWLPGWFLIGAAALFAGMWLREIIPDLAAGRASSSAAAWRVPTNPVHVLDLAIFLPAVCASGVLLLRRRRLGERTAPASLAFLALTCLPIVVTPFIAAARGDAHVWSVVLPIGVFFGATIVVLWRLLRSLTHGGAVGAGGTGYRTAGGAEAPAGRPSGAEGASGPGSGRKGG